MTVANYLNVGSTAMLHDEQVNAVHCQSGHGVLQFLRRAAVTWQAAHLKDTHHLVPKTFQCSQGKPSPI